VTLSRRQILAGAAATAAGAAMPAAAIAEVAQTAPVRSILSSLPTMDEFLDAQIAAAEAKAESIAFMKMLVDAKRASQKALAGVPADAQWVYFEDEDGNLITGHFEIIGDDPVRHPEGREDTTEYA
jgi:hypothetical protein